MRGRDEVVRQRLSHVLVNSGVVRVENAVLLRQHVHGEPVGGHELVLLGCTGQKGEKTCEKRRKGNFELSDSEVSEVSEMCVAATDLVGILG